MSGRRIVRWSVRVLGILVVVALAALLVVRIYGRQRRAAAERSFAAAVGPVGGNPCASPRVPDEENAAVYLRAGSEALILPGKDKALVAEMSFVPPQEWTEVQRAEMRLILTRNGPAMALLHRAPGCAEASFGFSRHPDVASLLKLMSAQRLLYLDSSLALQAHQSPRFLASASGMSAMARSLEAEASLIAGLVGVACEKMFLTVAAQAMAAPALDQRSIVLLEHRLVDVDLDRAWKRSLACEGRLPPSPEEVERFGGRLNVWQRLTNTVLADARDAQWLEVQAFFAGAIDVPYGDALSGRAERRMPSAPVTRIVVPNLVSAVGRYQVVLSERRLARIALALRLEGMQAGVYPQTLEAFKEAQASDPFTGGGLSYTLRPDRSAELKVPDGVKLWNQLNPDIHNPGPFAWELPAPPPFRPKGS